MQRPARRTTRQARTDRPLDVRALLESTGTPFGVGHYEPRAAIFLQGDPCDSVMHIEKGRVRLGVTAPNGKEAICGLLGMGEFLGEEALGGRALRRRTATAMAATEVLVIAEARMRRLLHTQPAIADRFMGHLLTRHLRLEADLIDQLLYSSEQRLAHTLLVLGNCNQQGRCPSALPDVSQEILAEMVGTTRSRVSNFMGKFKKLGFIETTAGGLEVNPSRLDVVHPGYRRTRGDGAVSAW